MASYTSPTVRLPDGSYVMESRKIADALERLQPEPSLLLDSAPVDYVQKAVDSIGKAIAPIGMPRLPETLLLPRSADYFQEACKELFGMPLSEVAKSDIALNGWKNAEPSLHDLVKILSEHPEGPYVLGKTPSYPDLIITGLLKMGERLDLNGDFFGPLVNFDESIRKHYEACKKWTERDD